MVYDGHIGYQTNAKEKTYILINNPSDHLLYSGAGRLILKPTKIPAFII